MKKSHSLFRSPLPICKPLYNRISISSLLNPVQQPAQSRYLLGAPSLSTTVDSSQSSTAALVCQEQPSLLALSSKLQPDEEVSEEYRHKRRGKRRAFVASITLPSPRRGYLTCRLCSNEIWGPNGRYHIENCHVIREARQAAKRSYSSRIEIAGLDVSSDIFEPPKRPQIRVAKVAGFVLSASVAKHDPSFAPTLEEIEQGIQVGRKGYVRCVKCNAEVFAPNARHHTLTCPISSWKCKFSR